MSKHTVGPWRYLGVETIDGPDHKPVAKVSHPPSRTNEEIHANGHLIAAAPELFALLSNLENELRQQEGEWAARWGSRISLILSKAEGK